MHNKIIIFICLSLSFGLNFDATQSYVTYKGNHPAHSWEGKSTNINSTLNCGDENGKECILEIEIPIESFDSNNTSRDSNMFYYTESLKYPMVYFKSYPFDFKYPETISIKGDINFHGITKKLTILADINSKKNVTTNENLIIGDATFKIVLSEHDVKRPSLLFIKISDSILLQAHLEFIK